MKITKTANGNYKVKLTVNDWKAIGEANGWTKAAQISPQDLNNEDIVNNNLSQMLPSSNAVLPNSNKPQSQPQAKIADEIISGLHQTEDIVGMLQQLDVAEKVEFDLDSDQPSLNSFTVAFEINGVYNGPDDIDGVQQVESYQNGGEYKVYFTAWYRDSVTRGGKTFALFEITFRDYDTIRPATGSRFNDRW